jgi:hypothetical protein
MKKVALVVFSLLVLSLGLLFAQEAIILKVKVQTANVRSEADPMSPVVKQLKLGTLIESRRKVGDWYEVKTSDERGTEIVGFLHSNTVDVISGKVEAGGEQAGVERPGRKPAPEESPVIRERYGASPGGVKLIAAYGFSSMTYTVEDSEQMDKYRKPRMGFAGGIGFESGGMIGIEADLLYFQKGVRFQGTEQGADFDVTFALDEVCAPVLLKIHLINRSDLPDIFLEGGGEIAYIISSKVNYTINAPDYGIDHQTDTQDIKDNINKIDYGLVFGGGVILPLGPVKLCLEGRYHMGLADLEKTTKGYEGVAPESAKPHTNAILGLVGLKF